MEYRPAHSNEALNAIPGVEGKALLNDLYLDLFLKHVHSEQVETYYLNKIDQALDARDEQLFIALTNDYLQHLKQE